MSSSPLDAARGDARGDEIRAMFSRIAPTYDRANRVLSVGIDARWRRVGIRALAEGLDGHVLDLCCGTLDLTLGLLSAGAPRVTGLDFAAPMIEAGRSRLPPGAPVQLDVGDAQDLPYGDGQFSGAINGFGMRNVQDNGRALGEVHRVLGPGGRFVVLEFFRPVGLIARAFHRVFNRIVLPLVGGLISGDRSAYDYLARSMEGYLSRAEFEALAAESGFVVEQGREFFPPVASIVVLRRAE